MTINEVVAFYVLGPGIKLEHWYGNIERSDICAIITEISLVISLFVKIVYLRINLRNMLLGALEIMSQQVTALCTIPPRNYRRVQYMIVKQRDRFDILCVTLKPKSRNYSNRRLSTTVVWIYQDNAPTFTKSSHNISLHLINCLQLTVRHARPSDTY